MYGTRHRAGGAGHGECPVSPATPHRTPESPMRNRSVLAVLSLAAAAVMAAIPLPAAAAPGTSGAAAGATETGAAQSAERGTCPQLSKKLDWYGNNRAKLQ